MLRKRILLAVDNVSLLSLNEVFSPHDRYLVRTTADGSEALRLLSEERPDLAIIDAELPGVAVHACCSAINTSAVPVVMLADSRHEATLERCRAAGCNVLLEKPFAAQAVAPVISRILYGERRREPRTKVRIPVNYGLDAPDLLTDHAVNLSAGGLFLESNKTLPIDTVLMLEFTLPYVDIAVTSRARVAWLNGPILRSCPLLPQGMGLQFLALNSDRQQAIRTFLTTETLKNRLSC
jgi:uncharacterized protein (TIGR02266 family)